MIEHSRFRDIAYLLQGNLRQRRLHRLLSSFRIMEILEEFSPLLTGTIPIGIDLPGSDVDIACHAADKAAFMRHCRLNFSVYPDFRIKEQKMRGRDSTIVRFRLEDELIELFAQDRPAEAQEACRHMLIEDAILRREGSAFRRELLKLKEEGLSTEAAFARLLGLGGDPYLALLDYGREFILPA